MSVARRNAFFWHTDSRTVSLFYKFCDGEVQPHEFLNRLLLVKDSVDFVARQDVASGLTTSAITDDAHEEFLGIG